ncbi:hypothetical protein ADICYQ_4206 [Cyclobacterium qasimii M12-11B]|uniref:Uncharacterized protein n=1 Tax=Cyclobacterium qasimii M12-11B TaxID=641524 RepID=S7WJ92_9BACT|nr:hypothetical protein ADICYQ_4206 [Cyclobacterium qasimii M12-11B]
MWGFSKKLKTPHLENWTSTFSLPYVCLLELWEFSYNG